MNNNTLGTDELAMAEMISSDSMNKRYPYPVPSTPAIMQRINSAKDKR